MVVRDQLPTTLKAALLAAAAEVEDEQGVPVEVVTVGDCDTDEGLQALVRAAREAMVNAAKHSGAARVDGYAEVDEDRVEVFVRDRGQGFDLTAIGEDRLGVTRSIIDRMRVTAAPRPSAATANRNRSTRRSPDDRINGFPADRLSSRVLARSPRRSAAGRSTTSGRHPRPLRGQSQPMRRQVPRPAEPSRGPYRW